ncbi:hypothetical protein QBC42DRAFT_283206 [Cladorrhinum samala]|uniref:Uncharacterized protein n=1 Tax=Cladorrhinum samala TaxID=585594 RepID=A0AAV9HXZ3_9PEZI|nr:hypothetical protein QBC42DRAFT_283206 [Cladorrhinum samala]
MVRSLEDQIKVVTKWFRRNKKAAQQIKTHQAPGTNQSKSTASFAVRSVKRLKSLVRNTCTPPTFVLIEPWHLTEGDDFYHGQYVAMNRELLEIDGAEISELAAGGAGVRRVPLSPEEQNVPYQSSYVDEDELFLPAANLPAQPDCFFVGICHHLKDEGIPLHCILRTFLPQQREPHGGRNLRRVQGMRDLNLKFRQHDIN